MRGNRVAHGRHAGATEASGRTSCVTRGTDSRSLARDTQAVAPGYSPLLLTPWGADAAPSAGCSGGGGGTQAWRVPHRVTVLSAHAVVGLLPVQAPSTLLTASDLGPSPGLLGPLATPSPPPHKPLASTRLGI